MSPGVGPDVFVGDLAAVRRRLVEDVSREAGRSVAERGRFALAVPGGSVARDALPALVSVPFDWGCTHVFWVDERAVPRSDPESNLRVVSEAWLTPAGAPATSAHAMPANRADLARAADDYDLEIRQVLGDPPRLDYVLLGVGPDGHVASLFPGHPALADTSRLAVAVFGAPKPPPSRLTLTMPLLLDARRVVVMALDASKAPVIEEVFADEASTLPVSTVLRRARRPLLLLDASADGRRVDEPE